MKYSGIACRKLVLYMIFAPICLFAFILLIELLLVGESSISAVDTLKFLCLYLMLYFLFCLPCIKSFSRFTMTEEGIGNKYLFYKWEDIDDYKEFEFTFNRFRFPQFNISIIYFGEERVNSYRGFNTKKHIFFEDTPKNVEMLKRFRELNKK